MTVWQKLEQWLAAWPEMVPLARDGYGPAPDQASLMAEGSRELDRWQDALGNVTVEYRQDYSLHLCLAREDGRPELWLERLGDWLLRQSALGLAPVFGDQPAAEGVAVSHPIQVKRSPEGTAVYKMELSVTFRRRYEAEHG